MNIKQIIYIANKLDNKKMYKAADIIDNYIKIAAYTPMNTDIPIDGWRMIPYDKYLGQLNPDGSNPDGTPGNSFNKNLDEQQQWRLKQPRLLKKPIVRPNTPSDEYERLTGGNEAKGTIFSLNNEEETEGIKQYIHDGYSAGMRDLNDFKYTKKDPNNKKYPLSILI